jgi:hypothetical protein
MAGAGTERADRCPRIGLRRVQSRKWREVGCARASRRMNVLRGFGEADSGQFGVAVGRERKARAFAPSNAAGKMSHLVMTRQMRGKRGKRWATLGGPIPCGRLRAECLTGCGDRARRCTLGGARRGPTGRVNLCHISRTASSRETHVRWRRSCALARLCQTSLCPSTELLTEASSQEHQLSGGLPLGVAPVTAGTSRLYVQPSKLRASPNPQRCLHAPKGGR